MNDAASRRGSILRLAATLILARPAADGNLEMLLVRRSARSAFAPDAFVFPGGTVDPQDYERTPGWSDVRVAVEFRATVPPELPTEEPAIAGDGARALVNAAVRELREEAAIDIATADIHLFSHWITPPSEPRRYNTHFFIARANAAHIGTADRVETYDARWTTASDALAMHRAGKLYLVYPTIKHLERLAEFDNMDALLGYAQSKPIITIMPNMPPHEGFVMPSSLEGRW